jgi:hypothetical protein
MKNLGCASLIGAVVVIIAAFNSASKNGDLTPLIIITLLAAIVIVWYLAIKKQNNKETRDHLEQAATKLEALSKDLAPIDPPGFATTKGETAYFKLDNVSLTEWRSTGSTYQGGSQGVSFRIAKGVSYRVGASRGTLTKNPEQLQIVDSGSAIFTDKRIVFVGAKYNREWDFSKLVNVDVGTNGYYINIAVTNRQKNSGLQASNNTDMTPGILAGIVMEIGESGVAAAKKYALEVSKQMRDVLAKDEKPKA